MRVVEHGGPWTDDKLQVMQRYFSAYAQALKNQPFERWYIDAFAGTGERIDTRKSTSSEPMSLFGDENEEITEAKEGSVRIALGIDPPFNRYVFVDKSNNHIAALETLKSEFPNHKIDTRSGDANQVLCDLARNTNWRATRAAIFIDPYGMQVDWGTLQALSNTKSVDIALLFPTGPLNRMLVSNGNIPAEWESKIDSHLGLCNWRSASYKTSVETDLFSIEASSIQKTMNAEGLRQFVLERLKSIFAYVCERQLEMKNSKGSVLYHLFIICANDNPKAIKLAEKLASSAVNLRKHKKRS